MSDVKISATKITKKDIENLALLSRIKIDDNEKTQLVKEIDSILAYVDTIKKATINSAPSVDSSSTLESEEKAEERIGAVKNVTRDDEARTLSKIDRERILVEVPDRVGDFVAVKKIL